jgi:hypothetical protein
MESHDHFLEAGSCIQQGQEDNLAFLRFLSTSLNGTGPIAEVCRETINSRFYSNSTAIPPPMLLRLSSDVHNTTIL